MSVFRAAAGGTTTYVAPGELLVQSNPYGRNNPLAERTSDMAYLVLRATEDTFKDSGRYGFNIDWRAPLEYKKYMVCVESFQHDPSVEPVGTAPFTVGWSYRAPNAYDSARSVTEATLAVCAGDRNVFGLKYGASFTANGGEALGYVEVVLRHLDGTAMVNRHEFILSLYLLPINDK